MFCCSVQSQKLTQFSAVLFRDLHIDCPSLILPWLFKRQALANIVWANYCRILSQRPMPDWLSVVVLSVVKTSCSIYLAIRCKTNHDSGVDLFLSPGVYFCISQFNGTLARFFSWK